MTKTDLEFESEGVLNPAAIRKGDSFHLFYRAVRNGSHSSIGYYRLALPTSFLKSLSRNFVLIVQIPTCKYGPQKEVA